MRGAAWMLAPGLFLLCAHKVSGQTYPIKAIRIVTADVGGGADFMARLLAQGMAGGVGQQVVVENRGGAGGAIAMEAVAKAPPDGYTLLLFSNGMWTLPFLQKVAYDPVKDFAPVSLVDRVPNLLVAHPSLPARTVPELIALARARPGQLNWAAGSNGSAPHIAGELFRSMARIDVVRIAYKGTGKALIDLVGGQVQYMFPNAAAVTPHVKSGRLKALAVTGAERSALFPELPTIAASGLPGYQADTSHGVFAPAGTSRYIIERLNDEIVRLLRQTDTRNRLLNNGVEPVGTTPEQLAAAMTSEMTKMGKVIKEAGIRTD
ncbi:MAG TPA: tripartite tricarboxylate transporter substrate binding protein [Burkholderiales bacterium]|nr:tripartite tricarboxylate transporter substrate binding protein [Burkholderiales bacterium]